MDYDTERLVINRGIEVDCNYIGLGELQDVVQGWIEQYGPDAVFKIRVADDYGTPTVETTVTYKVLETDQEFKKRMELYKAWKLRERNQYELFKKKFENK